MNTNKLLQISSLGSIDKNNTALSKEVADPNKFLEWDNSPNNPIIQGFQGMFNDPTAFDSPEMQTKLFDVDNLVKGQAGIYRTMQDGLTQFGSDIDGKPLYAMNDLRDDQSFDLGKNKLYTAGSMMQQLGAFSDEEEADTFAKFTSDAGDPEFMGAIAGLSATGDKKGAVNLIMKEFGYPEVDSLADYEDKDRAYGTAFSAFNFVENVEKMSPAQQSLTLSTMGMMSFKFKDGTTLKDRALVKGANGETKFSLGDAFNIGGTGADVFSMQKNWDQLEVIQQISFGKGGPGQIAATGKRMQMLGDPSMGGSAVRQTDADLGRLGFTAVPSAGMGAITGNAAALPSDYEVIGAGTKQGQVIAVPKGLSFSAGTINGTTEIRSLNNAEGVKPASIGAFKTHSNWLPNKSTNSLRGTSFAAGLGQSGALQDPYLTSALATSSVYGNTVTKAATKTAVQATVGDAAEAGVKGGLPAAGVVAGAATGAAQISGATKLAKGEDPSLVEKAALFPVDGGASFIAGSLGGAFGGKSKEQSGRDAVRKLGTQSGLINKDNWTVTLSDGSTADVGKDGKSEKHTFRDPSKAVGEVRDLNPYDVDYTNDLDFSSNMMTNSLVRMMSGGKGTSIDQVAGQLGNAALGKVGFGQDMTEENFNYVRDNVRSFYFKQGIQTKEDAFALSNQMVADGRITEIDAVAMQQGINMTFDDRGYETAQVLMAGRWKGLEVAADIDKSPGPNYDTIDAKPMRIKGSADITDMVETQEVEPYALEMNAGTYGGNANTDIFTRSVIKYKDPWSVRNARR